ncbi:MAG: glutamate mutase L, partial [Candidatus Cloacimonadaceae bacterium]|nr:glutamate mutase L [Candidatus Cloacimonadaceae bacterium]
LDTFAIDDRRNSIEQMLSMRMLHPDMILLCGGVDGGAISGVLRLAEIIRIANPQAKYDSDTKIPMIFAGNADVADLIKKMVGSSFDLHIMPNLRPTMSTENLKPTQDMIQKLFMENVMERAPGYKELKKTLTSPILPTPIGVLKSMQSITSDEKRNLLAFDIGGATTDVFSYIHGHYQRTVSANHGMSYSAMNVMKEAGIKAILHRLPEDFQETEVRNYIGNKTLYPTSNPKTDRELMIEHAVAKEALRMALIQHQDMHYNQAKVGYLDNLKAESRDKYERQFRFQELDTEFHFYPSDIDIVLGAGGVFSHCSNPLQAVMMLLDGVMPKGLTEVCIDKHFVSPHLGVLQQENPTLSASLLESDCIAKLAFHVAPLYKVKKASYPVMEVAIDEDGKKSTNLIMSDQFYYYGASAKPRKFTIQCQKNVFIGKDGSEQEIETSLPVIIDTREDLQKHQKSVYQTLKLYSQESEISPAAPINSPVNIQTGSYLRKIDLPYAGEIYPGLGAYVKDDDIVAQNPYGPPRLYVVNTYGSLADPDGRALEQYFKIKPGDKVEVDQILLNAPKEVAKGRYRGTDFHFASPVRGKVEVINYDSGTIILSEIQEYAIKPITIDVSGKLMVKPKQINNYIKKLKGDFVYRGDLLAQKMQSDRSLPPVFVKAPDTGTITEINTTDGTVTIQYTKKPIDYLAHVNGKVVELVETDYLVIEYTGTRIEGVIGFGSENHGILHYLAEPSGLNGKDLSDKIIYARFDCHL